MQSVNYEKNLQHAVDLAEINAKLKYWRNKSSDYIYNVATAATNTMRWIEGDNKTEVYANDRVTNEFRNSSDIEKAYDDYLETGISEGRIEFGSKGLFKAGLNPIRQFVGTYNYKIYNIDGTIQFTLTNTTSFASAAYHLWPYKWNWFNGPMSNFDQIYIFTYSNYLYVR